MKGNFQIMSIDDEFKSGNGIGYAIGLINLKNDQTNKYFGFGVKIDGEDYREDCWRADIGIGDTDIFDILSYIGSDGIIHEYGSIDIEFKEEILDILNIKNRTMYKKYKTE